MQGNLLAALSLITLPTLLFTPSLTLIFALSYLQHPERFELT